MKKTIVSILAVLLFGLVGTSHATTIFSDNFDAENGGVGILNYTGFTNWTVSNGAVDLIGNTFFDFLPGNGLYVDLDGSMSDAGLMSNSFNLAPGSYILSYSLAGNHRDGAGENVNVSFGSFVNTTQSLSQNAPFTTFTHAFTVNTASLASLSFEGVGGDNIGMLLDNVKLEQAAVPEPGTMVLLGMGLCGMVAIRRIRKKA